MMQKTWTVTETLASGHLFKRTQRELTNEYQHDRDKMIIVIVCFFVHWTKLHVTLAAERINTLKGGNKPKWVFFRILYIQYSIDIQMQYE